MADNDAPVPAADEPAPVPAEETVQQPAVAAGAAPAPEPKQKLTDRLFNFRAMVAVALAALLLGGGVGAAITAVAHDDGPDRRPGFARFGDGPGFPGGPGFGPGDRQQLRRDYTEMRKDFRKRMKEFRQQQDQQDAPSPTTPSPSATPNG